MSIGQPVRPPSSASERSAPPDPTRPAPVPSLTPENAEGDLLACSSTNRLLLLAQRHVILCIRHDTLAIERRLEKHKEDISWLVVDTVSEKGTGRYAVSYDVGNTAIVWDIHAGVEVARFAAYGRMTCAAWMKNGNIVFGEPYEIHGTFHTDTFQGNEGGDLVLFEPQTQEHVSVKLIHDPITCVAPYWDCRQFAVG